MAVGAWGARTRLTETLTLAPPAPSVFPGSGSRRMIGVIPIATIPHVRPGDDLAVLIADAMAREGLTLEQGDIVIAAQKIVSKSERRQVALADVTPSPAAIELAQRSGKDPRMAELILLESAELMRVTPQVIIARHRLGHVLANAGIDQSNIDSRDAALLWPVDPDASARRLRQSLEARAGVELAVIVSDSMGRAWRWGTTGSAIGVSGMKPLHDRRGEPDLFGRIMQATLIAKVDEIAAAASLVMGEADEAIPAAIVRGVQYRRDTECGIASMLRALEQDLFR